MGHEWAYIRLFQTTFEKLERIQGLKRLVYAWEFFLLSWQHTANGSKCPGLHPKIYFDRIRLRSDYPLAQVSDYLGSRVIWTRV